MCFEIPPIFAIYLLTSSVTTPIYGKLTDLFGRKSVFIFGVTLFVIGSMVSGMAQGLHMVFILVFAISIITFLISALLPSCRSIIANQKAD